MIEEMISKRMKFLLKERGWSPYLLTKKSGASKTSVYNVVNGTKSVEVETLYRMVDALGMTMKEFFDFETVDYVYLDKEEKQFIESIRNLGNENQRIIRAYVQGLTDMKNKMEK